jgi:hypothetical protein
MFLWAHSLLAGIPGSRALVLPASLLRRASPAASGDVL